MSWWNRCYCPKWTWPLVWRKDAEAKQALRLKQELQAKDRELQEERAILQRLISRVVEIGERKFRPDRYYSLTVNLDARWMAHGFIDRREQAYFAEYVARNVESEVARMIVVQERHLMRG